MVTLTQACVGEFNEFQCEIIIGSLTYNYITSYKIVFINKII